MVSDVCVVIVDSGADVVKVVLVMCACERVLVVSMCWCVGDERCVLSRRPEVLRWC